LRILSSNDEADCRGNGLEAHPPAGLKKGLMIFQASEGWINPFSTPSQNEKVASKAVEAPETTEFISSSLYQSP
jgi:hypothetical protein